MVIHGGVAREARRAAIAAFNTDPVVRVHDRQRRRRRGREPPARRASDGQLRPALEPEPAGAALRPHPPHRPDRGLPPLEPLRRQHPRGRGLSPPPRKAGRGARGARRQGLRRAGRALRRPRAARPAGRRDPLRRPAGDEGRAVPQGRRRGRRRRHRDAWSPSAS